MPLSDIHVPLRLGDVSGSGLLKEWYQYQGAECLLISNRDTPWPQKKSR